MTRYVISQNKTIRNLIDAIKEEDRHTWEIEETKEVIRVKLE